jgi:hypothetical protein
MSTIDAAVSRLRAEFLEMPGLRLTAEQVQRLCGLERTVCQVVLEALVDAQFLRVSGDGYYARHGEMSRPRAVKADLRSDPRVAKAS